MMVEKELILRNLLELESRYNEIPDNPRLPLYFAKLSLIELCGWIEYTMDEMILYCAKKHVKAEPNINQIEMNIRNTHGFSYKRDFRVMLIGVLGLVHVEKLESQFETQKFEMLRSSLGTLREKRNTAAHNYIDAVTQNIMAPSLIIVHFQHVYVGLKDIEECLRQLDI